MGGSKFVPSLAHTLKTSTGLSTPRVTSMEKQDSDELNSHAYAYATSFPGRKSLGTVLILRQFPLENKALTLGK